MFLPFTEIYLSSGWLSARAILAPKHDTEIVPIVQYKKHPWLVNIEPINRYYP